MNNNDFYRLKCPVCERFYKNKDKVFLDEFNTVVHQSCYGRYTSAQAILDQGTYRSTIEKYDFFHELIN
ncbi:hypothetical protein CFK37_09115 [Virgibacillus phasianinus]|uniref:Uncharacterized protein n=1 Tax=Virgibacillus phasianinus TaxID=2017483 RepID=A0A220U307_9BACI|nr:hypothetical protein [Virgibacillus phasianinus]ASK62306.1 hypothetical protein CFK37_09115 [Virgibacillus phasianinus]